MKLPKLPFDLGTIVAAAAVCGLLSLAPRAQAFVIASDIFNYPDGTALGGQSGGTGAWTTPWTPVAPATNGTFVVSNGIVQSAGNDAGTQFDMRRAVTVPSYTTTPYYFRYDYMVPAHDRNTEGNIFGGLTIGPTGVGFGANDVLVYSQDVPFSQDYHLRLKVPASGSIGNPAMPLVYGTNYTIVTRIEPNYIPTQSRVTIWLTNSMNAGFMTESAPAYMQTIMNTVITPSFVGLYRQDHTVTSVSYDNVFLGTGLGYVVPEPTTAALVALGLVGLRMRSRKVS